MSCTSKSATPPLNNVPNHFEEKVIFAHKIIAITKYLIQILATPRVREQFNLDTLGYTRIKLFSWRRNIEYHRVEIDGLALL